MSERIFLSEDELKETTFLGGQGDVSDGEKLPILKRIEEGQKSPTVVIVIGMAGSGKTTLMTQLQRSLKAPCDDDDNDKCDNDDNEDDNDDNSTNQNSDPPATPNSKVGYCVNLDPATKSVPFGASIDIRDTVSYKQVMVQHNLGPNGAIMTSLNLFATKFDQVLSLLDARAPTLDYVLVDTPGQIEAFTWSASGTIVTSALASSFRTVVAFVVDTPRCTASPNTFMSNMLYACSVMYRTKLPLVVVFNKSDVVPASVCMEWMRDYDVFQSVLDGDVQRSGYYGSLTRSLSLVLDEFYEGLTGVGVSAVTGDGVDTFWDAVDEAAKQFDDGYLQDLKCRVDEIKAKKMAKARGDVRRLQKDLKDEGTL